MPWCSPPWGGRKKPGGAWYELFSRDPERRVGDPSLSPATRAIIESIRDGARPLSADVKVRWLSYASLRVDILLQGGLRNATHVAWTSETRPHLEVRRGTVALAGRAATATVAVEVPRVDRMSLVAEAREDTGRRVLSFTRDLVLPRRPAAPEPELRVVEVPAGGTSWWWWVALGAVVVGGALTAWAVASPGDPDLGDGVGGFEVPR